MNLISNSLKFTYQGKIEIEINIEKKTELFQTSRFLNCSVVDTGIGIYSKYLGWFTSTEMS